MPIIVKDFEWSESKGEVIIKLPLKGVKASKVDVVATESYLKASYPPYLFESFLHGAVQEQRSSCTVGEGLVHFRLLKREEGLWGRLQTAAAQGEGQGGGDKEVLKGLRGEALRRHEESQAERERERASRKTQEERFAVKEQIRLNQEERGRMESKKQDERDKAATEMEQWKESNREERTAQRKAEGEREVVDGQGRRKEKSAVTEQAKSVPLWDSEEEEAGPTLNPVRGSGKISIKFTPRVLPTAARESKAAEEQEWLAKMAEARRFGAVGTDGGGPTEERDPEALKEKGNVFFQHGDVEGAISAFSEAIAVSPALPSLYANRSACFLKKKDYNQCIEDCHKALELYYPVVPANQKQRMKVFTRRATAYALLGLHQLALQDLDAALEISPSDQQLLDNREQVRCLLARQPPHSTMAAVPAEAT